jgi:hypothetical protein
MVAALREYEAPFESVDPGDIDSFVPDDLARSRRGTHVADEDAIDAA